MENTREFDTHSTDEIEIDLGDLIQLMLQKLWIIILCFIVGAVLAFGGTKLLITPTYTSSSMIYILTKTTSVTSVADIQIGERLTVDFEILSTSRPVIEAVIDDLDLEYTYGQVLGMIETENLEDTRILKFKVTHEDPKMARDIANSLAVATSERVAYVMDTDEPNIVETAVAATAPSGPNTMRNTALGAMLGAMLAIGMILVEYLMNDTVQTEEDIRKYLNLHTLAAIPLEKKRGK